jgi:hypothetical protein
MIESALWYACICACVASAHATVPPIPCYVLDSYYSATSYCYLQRACMSPKLPRVNDAFPSSEARRTKIINTPNLHRCECVYARISNKLTGSTSRDQAIQRLPLLAGYSLATTSCSLSSKQSSSSSCMQRQAVVHAWPGDWLSSALSPHRPAQTLAMSWLLHSHHYKTAHWILEAVGYLWRQ